MRIFNTSGACIPEKHYTLMREGLSEGFYVVFSQKHRANDTLFFDEMPQGKRIRTYISRTDFEPHSTRLLEDA